MKCYLVLSYKGSYEETRQLETVKVDYLKGIDHTNIPSIDAAGDIYLYVYVSLWLYT